MCPTDLAARERQAVIAAIAVGDDNALHHLPEQGAHLHLAAREPCGEERPQGGSHRPQPAALAGVLARGLIDVLDGRLVHRLGQLCHRRGPSASASWPWASHTVPTLSFTP